MRFSELCQFSRHPTAPYCHRHVSFTMHCLAPEDNRTDLEPEIRVWIQVNVFKMCAVTPKTGTGTCLGYRGADSRETDLPQYQEVIDGFGKHVATWNGLCKGCSPSQEGCCDYSMGSRWGYNTSVCNHAAYLSFPVGCRQGQLHKASAGGCPASWDRERPRTMSSLGRR